RLLPGADLCGPGGDSAGTRRRAARASRTRTPGGELTVSEVAVYTPRERASLPAKVEYARFLAESGLLPQEYRKNPANVLYAVEYGDMIGIPPMAAITGIHVIEGKPTASAGLISGLVRKAGHQLRVGYDAGKMMGW